MVPFRSHLARGPRAGRLIHRLAGLGGVLLAVAMNFASARAMEADAVLRGWFESQTNLHTWSAEFTQTRTLKALAQPLLTRGRIWVALPDRFCWELGDPPQTIAVRQTNGIVIAYPRLRRAERYALGGDQPKPWKEALALLEAGFPRSRAELESRFRVKAVTTTNAVYVVTLEPRAAATRHFLPGIRVSLDTNQFRLTATEVLFPDGSVMRNDYDHALINPPLDETRFASPVGADFKVTEPAP